MFLSIAFIISFIASNNAFHIACGFKDSDVGFGQHTTCEPSIFDTSKDKLVETLIAWPLNRDKKTFTQFYVEHQDAVHFPMNLQIVFTNLQVVKIFDSRMKFIDNFDLRWLSKLTHLSLESNEIEVLQPELFAHNILLAEIHLQNNKIKFIGARLLVPLSSLRIVNLKNNVCIDDIAESSQSLNMLRRNLDENCAAPEFLVKKNAEFIKKVVDLNFANADLTSKTAKLEAEVKLKIQALATCVVESEESNNEMFKVEMKLRKETSALKKLDSELKVTKVSNDDLTIENVKLNNKLNMLAQKLLEAEETAGESAVLMVSNTSANDGSADSHRLRFENAKLVKDNQALKIFRDDIEKEWRAVTLHCEFTIWDGYACQNSFLKVRTDDSEIISVNGKHEGKKTNFDVKSFLISSHDVRTTFLPVNIGSIFPKLQHLIVQDSKLVFVKRRNFDNLLSLVTLKLDHNQISELSAEVFNDLENLITLDLSFNRLTKIDKEIFNGVKKLKFLAMNDNKLESLSSRIFQFNLQLEVVFLHNNKIKFIGSSMLQRLSNLKYVNFKSNGCIDSEYQEVSLKQIDERISNHCTPPTDVFCNFEIVAGLYTCQVVELVIENENTMVLDVIGNHQRDKSNDDVEALSVVGQGTFYIPVGIGKFLKNLRKIHFKNSKLSSIDSNSFELSTKIAQVILSENEIKTVSEDAFQPIKATIEVIDLSKNQIKQLELKTFDNLAKLKVLRLSSNKLHKLNSNLLKDNVNLEELFVDKNKLKTIGAYLMNTLSTLKLADFTANNCINLKFPQVRLQALKIKILEQCN